MAAKNMAINASLVVPDVCAGAAGSGFSMPRLRSETHPDASSNVLTTGACLSVRFVSGFQTSPR
jgi:hypothetical protein